MAIMKGTTTDCLNHYFSTLPPAGTRNVSEFRKPLADFTGAGVRTVERWALQNQPPIGANLIKVRFFLKMMGYEVYELADLASNYPINYRLAELVGFGLFDHAKDIYKLEFTDHNSVLRLCHGWTNTSKDREKKINALYSDAQEMLRELKDVWIEKARGSRGHQVDESKGESMTVAELNAIAEKIPSPKVTLMEVEDLPTSSFEKRKFLESIAHLVKGLLPLAELIASNKFTSDDRRLLRELAMGSGVFRLSNALNKLCGEKARDLIVNGHKPTLSHKS